METHSGYWSGVLASRISRRRALGATGGAALGTALLAACGGAGGGGASPEAGKVWETSNDFTLKDEAKDAARGGIYRSFRSEDQAGHYDAMVLAPSQVPFSEHVHEFLMAKNRGPGIDPKSKEYGAPVPALAASMELVGDGSTVTFKMRPNVKWHPVAPVNGRNMDMDDWKASFEHFMAKSPQRQSLSDIFDKAEFPDANTMVWRLKFPYAPMLARISSERFAPVIMPKELATNASLAEKIAIGTGYKILDVHQPSITMEYKKHAGYWGGDPFIDRWHVPIIPEYANQYAQFAQGNVMDFTPNPRDVLQLARDVQGAVIIADPIPDDERAALRFGRQNHKTLPWKDVRVRVAIREAIDFKSIGAFQSNQQQFQAEGFSVNVSPMTHLNQHPAFWLNPEKNELGAISKNYLYDLADAKKLVQAAGFNDPIEIILHTLPDSGGTVVESDQLIYDSLVKSGIFKVTLSRSANTVAHRNCRSLGQCDGIVLSGYTSGEDADHFIFRDYESTGNTEGEQAYPDPRIDDVARRERRELDVEKRYEHLREFQRVAGELMPAVPYVHFYTRFRFRWPWLHNAHVGGRPSVVASELPPGRPFLGGHTQWLDKEMPNRDKRI